RGWRQLSRPDRAAEPGPRDQGSAQARTLERGGGVLALSTARRTGGNSRRRALGRGAADADPVPNHDGRSRPGAHRRAHRGARSESGGTGRRVPDRREEARHLGAAGRAEAQHLAPDLGAPVPDGAREDRVPGNAGGFAGERGREEGVARGLSLFVTALTLAHVPPLAELVTSFPAGIRV